MYYLNYTMQPQAIISVLDQKTPSNSLYVDSYVKQLKIILQRSMTT